MIALTITIISSVVVKIVGQAIGTYIFKVIEKRKATKHKE